MIQKTRSHLNLVASFFAQDIQIKRNRKLTKIYQI